MAEEPGPSATEDALFFFGILVVLVVLWFLAGGPGKADLRGLFLAPPAPLGTGDAYGPQVGTSTQESQPAQPAESPDYSQPSY